MFFKRRDEELTKRLEEKFQALEQATVEENRKLETMNQNISQLQKSVQKHDMAIEDLLEEWDEKKSDEDNIKEKFREYENNERYLLELFEEYQEQFWNMKRFADEKDETWAAQIALMEKGLERCRQLCGISIIGECVSTVDYDLHEVIEVLDTTDPDKDKMIARIYRCGYIYKGQVKKKAQVSAYHAGNGNRIE